MIKTMREKSKMIDFDIVFFSAFIFIGIIFLLFHFGRLNFSMVDSHAEALQKETITSSNTLGEVEGTIESRVMLSSGGLIDTRYGIGVSPIYTTDQMVEWGLRKGNELISILQVIAQPLCILVFIIGCGKFLIGALSGVAEKGLLTMAASAIIYTCILYAPVLVSSLANFSAT